MDQDVTEITFSPMDAQGLVVKYVRSGWVFSQNAEIGQEDFLNCLVTGMEIEINYLPKPKAEANN